MLIAFHKPFAVLSQFTSDGSANRPLAEFGFPKNVYPIGRLDADSEGLLLLSDEPTWNDRLLHPRQAHEREYWAQVEKIPAREALDQLQWGVLIQDRKTLPCRAWLLDPQPDAAPTVPVALPAAHGEPRPPTLEALWDHEPPLERRAPARLAGSHVQRAEPVLGAPGHGEMRPVIFPRTPPIRFRKSVPDCWIALELIEGKNRQVRRMTAAIGHPTLRLLRVRIGNFWLGSLPPGQWRILTANETALVSG